MGIRMLLAFALISMIWTLVKSEELSSEAYWKLNLGNDVTMPNVVKQALLGTEWNKNFDMKSAISKAIYGMKRETNRAAQSDYSPNHYGAGVATTYTLPPAQAVNDGARPNRPTLSYNKKGSKQVTGSSVLFFLEKDLIHHGSTMKFKFFMAAKEAKFMPLEVANSIPFSSTKLPEILKNFEVNRKSKIANSIEETILLCEAKPIEGERKSCQTSLESIIDFAISRLGKNIKALSTEVDNETEQEYKVVNANKIKNDKNLVCHKMVYPYAVFLCHTLSKTDIYKVSLIDGTGRDVNAVAVCHKDTSPWYAGHIAFQLLKVKPGGAPICHFLNPDAMVWVTK